MKRGPPHTVVHVWGRARDAQEHLSVDQWDRGGPALERGDRTQSQAEGGPETRMCTIPDPVHRLHERLPCGRANRSMPRGVEAVESRIVLPRNAIGELGNQVPALS